MYKCERKVSKTVHSSILLLSVGAMTLGSPAKALAESVTQPLTELMSAQQNNKVVVTVVDDQNEPVIGASVLITSSNVGNITDINGLSRKLVGVSVYHRESV